MSELMRVNWMRLKKMKLFWIALPVVVIVLFLENASFLQGSISSSFVYTWEIARFFEDFFLIEAVVLGIYFGKEYSSGGLKNRIIAGYSRLQIYFSYWLISVIMTLLFYIAIVGGSIVIFSVVGLYYPIRIYLILLGLLVIAGVVGTSLLLLLFFMTDSATSVLVTSIIVVLLLVIAGLMLNQIVGSGSQDIHKADSGEIIVTDNSDALERGTLKREITEYVYDALPIIQFFAISDIHGLDSYVIYNDRVLRIVLFSIGWMAILLFAGNMVFRYKKVR